MEAVYAPELVKGITSIEIKGDEAKHIAALRIRLSESIYIINGQGLAAIAYLLEKTQKSFIFNISRFIENLNESDEKIALAIGILESRERFEFAIEKSIELGITDFFPLITDFAQHRTTNSERLRSKAIAAIKQCQRSRLPDIHEPQTIPQILHNWLPNSSILLTDKEGEKPFSTPNLYPTLILVGPEGGFSDKEIQLIKSDSRTISWKLAPRRLRAETAAVSAVNLAVQNL
jgi:16S rRNA (uracil1498-N3)-methyltransferase